MSLHAVATSTNPQAFLREGRALRRLANFWRPPALAWLGPDCVGVALAGELPVLLAFDGQTANSMESAFSKAVRSLLDFLEQRRWAGSRLRILGSDYWSRSLVLPLQGASPTDEELDQLLAHTLEQTYGKSMEEWTRRWDRSDAEALAIAWPRQPLEMLTAKLEAVGATLDEVVPASVKLVEALRGDAIDSWVLSVETGCLTIIRRTPSEFKTWRTLPMKRAEGEDEMTVLLQALDRERARLDDSCEKLLVSDLRPGGRSRWRQPQIQDQFAAARWTPILRDATMGAFSPLCSALQGVSR